MPSVGMPLANAAPAEPLQLAAQMRGAMRGLAASVAIIALRSARPFGMTATSLVSVTMTPPTLLLCVNRSASIHIHLAVGRLFSINLYCDGRYRQLA